MAHRNGIRLLLAMTLLATGHVAIASDGWYSTYEQARDAADEQGLPLLIHFHASYCGPCRQMKQQVFSQLEVQRQLRNGVAAVEVDVSQRSDLAARYGASTVPRDVVVYPGRAPETLNVGFKSTLAYLDILRSVSAQGSAIAAERAGTRPRSNQRLVTSQRLVGLDGFCPVKLMRDREWVSGREELSETYRGITYYFSDAEQLATFRNSPREFTPENLGCDPIVLYRDQRATAGKIKYGAFFDDQLFLFESAENRTAFKESPLKYARIRHAVKVDDLQGQRFN